MIKTLNLTSKGQVTIPKEIRDEAGIDLESKVVVMFWKGNIIIKAEKQIIKETAGSLNQLITKDNTNATEKDIRKTVDEAKLEYFQKKGVL